MFALDEKKEIRPAKRETRSGCQYVIYICHLNGCIDDVMDLFLRERQKITRAESGGVESAHSMEGSLTSTYHQFCPERPPIEEGPMPSSTERLQIPLVPHDWGGAILEGSVGAADHLLR